MPKSIKEIHKGDAQYEKPHIHFKDGHILKSDGTWRGRGPRKLTKEEEEAVKKIWPNFPKVDK